MNDLPGDEVMCMVYGVCVCVCVCVVLCAGVDYDE